MGVSSLHLKQESHNIHLNFCDGRDRIDLVLFFESRAQYLSSRDVQQSLGGNNEI